MRNVIVKILYCSELMTINDYTVVRCPAQEGNAVLRLYITIRQGNAARGGRGRGATTGKYGFGFILFCFECKKILI